MRDVPAGALQRLRDGNLRFSDPSRDSSASGGEGTGFIDLSAGQSPFAAVLTCFELLRASAAGFLVPLPQRVGRHQFMPTHLLPEPLPRGRVFRHCTSGIPARRTQTNG